MNIGIVGAGADKFTRAGELEAKVLIRIILNPTDAQIDNVQLVSGHSPMGGIDIWAEEIADAWRIPKLICAPQVNAWNPPNGQYGFRARNIDIARCSDILHNIVVKEYPPGYTGQRFSSCYHCGDSTHVKSGGCWTAKKAIEYGKRAMWHFI